MKKIIIRIAIITMIVVMVGCDRTKLYMQQQQPVGKELQNTMSHKNASHVSDQIVGGTYLRDEGILGFLWYVPLKESVSGKLEPQEYRFAQENIYLFLIGILAFCLMRLKKHKNMYHTDNIKLTMVGLPVLMNIGQSHIRLFIRAKLLFCGISAAIIFILATLLLTTDYIVTYDLTIAEIMIGFLSLGVYIYVYWHYIMLYTNMYVKKDANTHDVRIASDMTLIWVWLLAIVVIWFGVVGTLSGMFLPLLTALLAGAGLFLLKERTGFIRVLFSLYYNVKYFIFGSLSGDECYISFFDIKVFG